MALGKCGYMSDRVPLEDGSRVRRWVLGQARDTPYTGGDNKTTKGGGSTDTRNPLPNRCPEPVRPTSSPRATILPRGTVATSDEPRDDDWRDGFWQDLRAAIEPGEGAPWPVVPIRGRGYAVIQAGDTRRPS